MIRFIVDWCYHWMGLDDGSGAWYLWWSGFCGDLVFVGAFAGAARHFNCQTRGCPRLGFHWVGDHRVCHKHHPGLANTRSVPHSVIVDAHNAAQTDV